MARFYPIQDVIKLALLGNHDMQQRDKGRLLSFAPYVWQDLNLSSVKVARRELFQINKRTNTIDMPTNFLQISSVNVIDECGVLWPVYRNDKLHDDIVDISAQKDCACEYKCGYSLCNTIKGYEAIISTKSDFTPTGDPISFECIDRKYTDGQGFLYSQTQTPTRIYLSGVWTETVLETTNTKICEVEVDKNGCVCDTEKNINTICNSCGINNAVANTQPIPIGGDAMSYCNSPKVDEWIYYCDNKSQLFGVECGGFGFAFGYHNGKVYNNIYNISELGNRLIFPANFGWDKVLVRYYADIPTSELQIPFAAVDTFITGLKYWDCRWDDKKQNLAQNYSILYSKQKFGLLMELNKYRIAELRMAITPPVYVPSYNQDRGLGFYADYMTT